MVVWRLSQDWLGMLEGSCISDERFKNVYYADKILYEPITEESRTDWIEIIEPDYCKSNGLKCLLFFDEREVILFFKKLQNVASLN